MSENKIIEKEEIKEKQNEKVENENAETKETKTEKMENKKSNIEDLDEKNQKLKEQEEQEKKEKKEINNNLLKKEKKNEDNKNEEHLKKNKKSSKKTFIISLILGFILVILLAISIFSIYNINNEKIINGLKINNIDFSNKTIQEAEKMLEDYINLKKNEDIIFTNNENEIKIKPEEAGIIFYPKETIENAFEIGRSDNFLMNDLEVLKTMIYGRNIDLQFEIDEQILNKFVIGINENLEDAVKQPSYYIEGSELIINSGKAGKAVDKQALKNMILDKISNTEKDNEKIQIPIINSKPEKIDIEKIYKEIYREPKDAFVTKEPYEFHAHVEGIDLAITIDEAKNILKEEKEQYKIPIKIIKPNITNDLLGDEAFPDKLGSYSTNFSTANVNRSTNIRISVDKINNKVLMPGEEFSYNNAIGPTTPEAGYKPGAAYIGGKVVTDYGGGVCQTSSTLYNAALLSNLEITSRTSHYYQSDYVPIGRDATVYAPSLDFKFKNNRDYPIKIKASVDGGTIYVDIIGVKQENDYEVEIESYLTGYIPAKVEYENDSSLPEGTEVVKEYGSSGTRSETYKILKKNGEVISKTLISRDVYSGHTKVIRRGTKKQVQQNTNKQQTDAKKTQN